MTELSKNIKSDLQAQSDLLIKMNYKIYKQSRLHMIFESPTHTYDGMHMLLISKFQICAYNIKRPQVVCWISKVCT
jgi:hypothetical protein